MICRWWLGARAETGKKVLRRKRKDKEGGPPEAEGGMGGGAAADELGGKRKANPLLLAKSSSLKKKVHWPDVQWAPPKHPSHGALSTTHDRDRGRGCGAGGAQLRRLHNKRMPRWAPVALSGSRWVPARALPGCLSAAVLESGQEKGGGREGGGPPEWSRKERAAYLQ